MKEKNKTLEEELDAIMSQDTNDRENVAEIEKISYEGATDDNR